MEKEKDVDEVSTKSNDSDKKSATEEEVAQIMEFKQAGNEFYKSKSLTVN